MPIWSQKTGSSTLGKSVPQAPSLLNPTNIKDAPPSVDVAAIRKPKRSISPQPIPQAVLPKPTNPHLADMPAIVEYTRAQFYAAHMKPKTSDEKTQEENKALADFQRATEHLPDIPATDEEIHEFADAFAKFEIAMESASEDTHRLRMGTNWTSTCSPYGKTGETGEKVTTAGLEGEAIELVREKCAPAGTEQKSTKMAGSHVI